MKRGRAPKRARPSSPVVQRARGSPSPRRRSSQAADSERWDMDRPENWSTQELNKQLAAINIIVPHGMTKSQLVKMFKANREQRTAPESSHIMPAKKSARRGRSASATTTLADIADAGNNTSRNSTVILDDPHIPQHERGASQVNVTDVDEEPRRAPNDLGSQDKAINHNDQLESIKGQVNRLENLVADLVTGLQPRETEPHPWQQHNTLVGSRHHVTNGTTAAETTTNMAAIQHGGRKQLDDADTYTAECVSKHHVRNSQITSNMADVSNIVDGQ